MPGKTPRQLELERINSTLAHALKHAMPEKTGFALLMFDMDAGNKGFISYCSNAQRPDMIRALEEFLTKVKADA